MTLTAWNHFLTTEVQLATDLPDSEYMTALLDFAAIEITGPATADFLHGQFTTAVTTLDLKACQFSAWCNAKGQTRATFFLHRSARDCFIILLPTTLRASFIEQLKRYILRADVQVSDLSSACVAVGVVTVEHSTLADCDHLSLPADPNRHIVIASVDQQIARWKTLSQTLTPVPATAWQLRDMNDKRPWLVPATTERFLPQMLGLDQMNALNYQKGCYPGQEIIARLHFRGTLKRRLHRAHCNANATPTEGDPLVTPDNGVVGTVINAVPTGDRWELLAVIDDNVPDAPLFIGAADGATVKMEGAATR